MKISLIHSFSALAMLGWSAAAFADECRPAYHSTRCEHPSPGPRRVVAPREHCGETVVSHYRSPSCGGYVVCERPVEKVIVRRPVVVERPVVEEVVVVKRPAICKKVAAKRAVVEQPVEEEKEVVEQPVQAKEEVVEQPVEKPVVKPVIKIIEEPAEEETVIEPPAVQDEAAAVEQPELEEEQTVVETLPARCKVVTIAGERCWERDGVYYRHCQDGYRICHPRKHGERDTYAKGHPDRFPKPEKAEWPDRKPLHMPDHMGRPMDGHLHHPTEASHLHNDPSMGGKFEHGPMQTSHMNHGGSKANKDGKRF